MIPPPSHPLFHHLDIVNHHILGGLDRSPTHSQQIYYLPPIARKQYSLVTRTYVDINRYPLVDRSAAQAAEIVPSRLRTCNDTL